jgi:hypothetical protein
MISKGYNILFDQVKITAMSKQGKWLCGKEQKILISQNFFAM